MNHINPDKTSDHHLAEKSKPLEKWSCLLVDTASYSESIEIKPIDLQKNANELIIKTKLHSAKNPTEWRIKSRTCIETENLMQLLQVVSDYLIKQASSPNEPELS